MADITLQAKTGRVVGTRPSRRLRSTGMVPATMYGKDSEPVSISVNAHELRRVLSTDAGLNAIIGLEIAGETHTSLARQLQRHPTKGEIIHLDFVKISLTDRVDVEVAIEMVGEPAGLKDGGILETVANTVQVNTLVTAIPDLISVDVSELGIGDAIRVEDLPEIEGLVYLDDPSRTIATVSVSSAALVDEEEEAGEEEAEEEGEQPEEEGEETSDEEA